MKEKNKYEKVELKTKEENFVLISNKKHFYDLYVGDFYEKEHGHKQILNKISTLNKKCTLNIHISSAGGDTYLLLNYLNILQITQAKVTGFLNYGCSASALLFCACEERYCYEYSTIMYHTFSFGYNGKSQEVSSMISCNEKVMHEMMTKLYTGLNKSEFEKLKDGKDFWFDVTSMKNRKIEK